MSDVFATIYTSVGALVDTLVVSKYVAIGALVRGPLIAAAGIYMVLAGYAVMRGIANEPWGTILATGAKIGIIAAFATGTLAGQVNAAANGLGTSFQQSVGGSANGSAFDKFVAEISTDINRAGRQAPKLKLGVIGEYDNPVVSLVVGAVMAFAYVVAAAGVFILLFAKLAVGITDVFGPLFVGLAMFDVTRSMFFSWLSAILNYAILMAVIVLVAGLVTGSIGIIGAALPVPADQTNNGPFLAYAAAQCGILFVGGCFFFMCPQIASAMAGGAAAGAGQFASAVLPGAITRGAARASGRLSGKALTSAIRYPGKKT